MGLADAMVRLTRVLERNIYMAWLMILIAAVFIVRWSLDRSPPYVVLGYSTFTAQRGGAALIDMKIRRNPPRECTATIARYIFDSNKMRMDLGGMQQLNASALAQIASVNPEHIKYTIDLPDNIAPGPAKLVTAASYRCDPISAIWPIETIQTVELTILP